MKSRISFFNAALFRKNLTRFAPAWVLYSVFMLIFLVVIAGEAPSQVGFASDILYCIGFMGVLGFGYALLCAQLLFGDLYQSRMCNALHAMPLRRETVFFTNVLSGLSFALIPDLVLALICTLLLGNTLTVVPLLWLGAVTLEYLFFFGCAVLSAYCVGNRFAMLLVYLILNGFSVIVYWLVETLYAPLLYGIELTYEPFLLLCPVVQLNTDITFVEIIREGLNGHALTNPYVHVIPGGWIYLAVFAALGAVYGVAALLLYRRRQLESAGDPIAFRPLRPCFLVLYTLCGAVVVHGFFSVFLGEDSLIFLVIGIAIGAFTGSMLLERTVRVFGKKQWLFFGGMLLATVLSLVLTRLDPIGITRWVPDAGSVKSVSFYTGGTRYDGSGTPLTDPAQIELITRIHRYGVEHPDAGGNGEADVRLYLSYEMKSGITVTRNYYIDIASEEGQLLQAILSSPEQVFGISPAELDGFLDTVLEVSFGENQNEIPPARWKGLFEAILADCAAGSMAQDWNYHGDEGVSWLTLRLVPPEGQNYHYYREFRLYGCCVNTMDWLTEHGYLILKFTQ